MNKSTFTKQFKKLLIIIVISFILLVLVSCKKLQEKSGSVYAFSTFINITIASSGDVQKYYNDVVAIYEEYNKLCDNFKEYDGINNIYTINHSDDYVEIDSKLKDLLVLALGAKNDTLGYFNPLIGNISSLYKKLLDTEDVNDIPSDEVLQIEIEKMNNSNILFVDNKCKIEGDATIDLGAIAKGYATQKVKEYLVSNNIKHYLIDAGSSSIILGEKQDSKYYRVGIKNVDNLVIQTKNKSVGTSSIFEQCVEINDNVYHHIINPKTGYPTNSFDIVVVIGDDVGLLDVLSTAFMAMPLLDIESLVKKYNDEGIKLDSYIYKNNELIYKSGNDDIYE